ncbi:MAG TPA: exonuclease SbcCD subunit D C-terminal domain-containing protein [Streptosporangiaceae bacterium]|jgi:exonuclease SbcD|nr:exonuclease SbcCD subunit D C-terminal domain-containing protein [Streptosporangiaceae bacterium]
MRLLHTSDWHLGRTLYGEDLLTHQAAFLDWLLAEAIERQVHAVVVAGDIYDRAVPTTDAVAVLDQALRGFAAARVQVLLTSGNHDSAVRLGFGSRLSELAGVHLRTAVPDIARPVLLSDEHGEVALYGIPYLLPDAVMADLGAERSHASVLAAAVRLIKTDATERGIARTIVAAHAFITGAIASESERDIRVGGIGDAPASLFAGLTYVALGHLHGQQDVSPGAGRTTVRYCGSPLAFSFSERHHNKSVTLAEIDGAGHVKTTKLATPVPRPLREVRGKLEDLLAGKGGTGAGDLAGAWVKVVLTDAVRPASPMERLREIWPHTLVLEFEPQGELVSGAADLRRLKQTADPVEICEFFVEYTSGGPADAGHRRVLRDVVEALRGTEAGADLAASGVVRTSAGSRTDLTDPAEAGSIDEWLENAGRTGDWLDAEPAGHDRDDVAGGPKERRAGSGRGDSAVA